MQKAIGSLDKQNQFAAFREYEIPDGEVEKEFEGLSRMASELCGTPISLITLIEEDLQQNIAGAQQSLHDLPRKIIDCLRANNHPFEPLIIPDLRVDSRFADHPQVKGEPFVVFYAHIPLTNPDGYTLGTLCVMDFQAKSLSSDQLASLQMLARQVVNVLELRKANLRLQQLKKELEASNEELQKFAYVVSHDIKSPLSSIVLSSEMLRENFGDSIDEGDDQLLKVLNRSAFKIRNLVDGILIYYRSERAMGEAVESFSLKPFLFSVAEMIGVNQDAEIKIFAGEANIKTKKAALENILINLLQYTLRNNENKKLQVNIRFSQDDSSYFFNISGIGNGLSETEEKEISELFATPGFSERFVTNSDLIGLSAVKKMVEKLSGKIEVSTLHGKGSEFSFHIRKES